MQGDFPYKKAIEIEKKFAEKFKDPNKPRFYFTYLLLDPAMADGLPQKANKLFEASLPCDHFKLFDTTLFMLFILSIFYVGKGVNNRAHRHFIDAVDYIKKKKAPMPEKIQHIVNIW